MLRKWNIPWWNASHTIICFHITSFSFQHLLLSNIIGLSPWKCNNPSTGQEPIQVDTNSSLPRSPGLVTGPEAGESNPGPIMLRFQKLSFPQHNILMTDVISFIIVFKCKNCTIFSPLLRLSRIINRVAIHSQAYYQVHTWYKRGCKFPQAPLNHLKLKIFQDFTSNYIAKLMYIKFLFPSILHERNWVLTSNVHILLNPLGPSDN